MNESSNHNIVFEKHSLKFPYLGELTCIAFAYKPFLKFSKPFPPIILLIDAHA